MTNDLVICLNLLKFTIARIHDVASTDALIDNTIVMMSELVGK